MLEHVLARMSHVPEKPQLYVCDDCYTVHAGVHDGEHNFQPPQQCGACEGSTFYRIENYPKHEG